MAVHTYKACTGRLSKEYSNAKPAQATYQVQGQPEIYNRPYLKKKKKKEGMVGGKVKSKIG